MKVESVMTWRFEVPTDNGINFQFSTDAATKEEAAAKLLKALAQAEESLRSILGRVQ